MPGTRDGGRPGDGDRPQAGSSYRNAARDGKRREGSGRLVLMGVARKCTNWAFTKETLTRTKEQKRAYDAEYRDTHKDEIRACDAEYRDAHKDEIRAYRAAHKDKMCERAAMCQRWFTGNLRILGAAQGCDDCGTHEGRLEHHHLDPASKTYSVSQMHKCLLEKFMDEVAKCTVLCRSCHLKRHAELRAA